MPSWIKRKRALWEDDLTRRGLAHTFSLARYTLHRATLRLIDEHATGLCLDVGSGHAPYRYLLAERCERVLTLDIERRVDDIDLIGDIQDLHEIESGTYDTVVCTQVLEHVPRPWDAIRELGRILRPGGVLILSVPHLSAMHEVPHDYYRYTRFGLASLSSERGFERVEIDEAGGLLCFFGHGISYLLLSVAAPIPLFRWIVWALNLTGLLILWPFDVLLGARTIYPCNLVMVASRASVDDGVEP